MPVLKIIVTFFLVFLQFVFAVYLLIPSVLTAIYFIKKIFGIKNTKTQSQNEKNFEFGIIVTAHEETQFIPPLVDSILKQTFNRFYVYIVADACDVTGLQWDSDKIILLKPETSLNSKIRSIDYALRRFQRKHDAIIILDADNLIHPKFLEVINNYFQSGYRVVQADFKPKNSDTLYSRMDAIGDMFNFFIEREARMNVGLSVAIWGSGIAIDTELYKEVQYANFLGGFDKKLQSHLLMKVNRIAFASEAILFDEKISTGKSLQNQRTRWINSYFNYFKESLHVFFQGLRKLDFNLIYCGFIILRPPLFIVVSTSIGFAVLNYFINILFFFFWLGALALFILTFVGIVSFKGKNIKYIAALFALPLFIVRQAIALLKIKRAKKSFIKTQHNKLIFIDDILKRSSV